MKGIRLYQHRELLYNDNGSFSHYILRMQQCRGDGTIKSQADLGKQMGKVNKVPQFIPRDGTNVRYKVHEVNTKVRPSTMILGAEEKGK